MPHDLEQTMSLLERTPAVLGMVRRVAHLVKVEDASEAATIAPKSVAVAPMIEPLPVPVAEASTQVTDVSVPVTDAEVATPTDTEAAPDSNRTENETE